MSAFDVVSGRTWGVTTREGDEFMLTCCANRSSATSSHDSEGALEV